MVSRLTSVDPVFDGVVNKIEGAVCPPQFTVLVGMKAQGIYSLKFHYCYNRLPGIQIPYSFTVS